MRHKLDFRSDPAHLTIKYIKQDRSSRLYTCDPLMKFHGIPIISIIGGYMRSFLNTIKKLWKDESGQGATEYILLLVIVVAIALLFRKQISGIVESKIGEIGGAISGFSINQ